MPNRNGSGPTGAGPMTGRGFGPCATTAKSVDYGYGLGRGFGRGCGFGRGFGFGRGYVPQPNTRTNAKRFAKSTKSCAKRTVRCY